MKAANKDLKSRMQARLVFSKKLITVMKNGSPLIIADESSYNAWQKNKISRTWQDPNDPITRRINTQRLEGVNMYGAITNF